MNIKELSKSQYRVHFLDVKDADAIIIAYKSNALAKKWFLALVDAGNVSDSQKIKNFLNRIYETSVIDLAICTHPDSDHKGGFFGLLEDDDVVIKEFWFKDLCKAIDENEFTRMKRKDSKLEACRKAYNHPSNSSKNIIDLAHRKCEKVYHVEQGWKHDTIPLTVLGPSNEYFKEAAIGIVQNYAELTITPDLKPYDENAEITEDSARSVINEENEESYTNMASIVLLFKPNEHFKILLTGDASCSSLIDIHKTFAEETMGCILKVPHHGSRRNMNTDLIDSLCPTCAIISAAGNEKHPNNNLVYYLSKYCNVYSTHKSGELLYNSNNQGNKANPLRKKMTPK